MNLKELVGHRYQVTHDASWLKETSENRTAFRKAGEEFWYYEIVSKIDEHWIMYPYSKEQLAISLSPRVAARAMEALGDHVSVIQKSDELITLKADGRYLTVLLKYLRPKSIRQHTKDQIAVMTARLTPYRFKGKQPPTMSTSKDFLAV